ncbi:MAG TPA: HDOD domain-containing protein [Bryobacteraceae bacterium]|nr:HDOD domain-containing protein [Bryobacteraceae bacterium]
MGLHSQVRPTRVPEAVVGLARSQPFSPVALRLLQLVKDEDVSFREVAVLMSRDAALSAEVLRLANSPVLGIRCEVRSVLQAISLLGLKRVVPLFMTSAVGRFCWPRTKSPLVRHIWRHGLATAFICENLGPQLQPMDHAYTAGLLHGLGQTALLALDAGRYEELAEISKNEGLRTSDVEAGTLGMTHAEASGLLLERWSLPAALVGSAREHEAPCEQANTLNGIVQAGCRVAEWLGFGGCESFAPPVERPELPAGVRQILGNKQLLDHIAEQINAVEIALWV